jgi:capsular polysaccharide biosynthesis protein
MAKPEGSRRSSLGWAVDVLRHGYRDGSLGEMLARAPRFVREDLLGERLRWWLLMRPLRDRLLDRATLTERASALDALWYAGGADAFTIDLPDRRDLPGPLAGKVGTYRPERPFVCEVRDARLVGPDAFAFVGGELVLETASASEMYLYFQLRDLYEDIAADRSALEAYRTYCAVLDGRQSLPGDPDRRARRPAAVEGSATTLAGETNRSGGLDGTDRFATGEETATAQGSTTDQERTDESPSLGTAAVFVPYWRNYYHWTTEFLPKVRLLERYEAATGREPTVLVEPDPPGWLLATLELAGWDGPIHEWTASEGRVERLVVPFHRNRYIAPHDSRFGDDFNPAPDDLRWLAARMQSNVPDVDGGDFPSRVFLSRKDTKFRPVADEDEVTAALEPLGFESFTLTELPLEDQIRLFVGADTIVSPHGAGLVNAIHASDATIVELFPTNNVEPYYFCLARQLGLDYEWAVYPTREDAMVVDTDHLRDLVAGVAEL